MGVITPTATGADCSRRQSIEDIEIDLLLDGIHRQFGYDFRGYTRSSMKRRILKFQADEKLATISRVQDKILHSEACIDRFITNVSINVTSMFRDPDIFLSFRRNVVPILRTYSSIRIWVAGCSTGEEVYSLAILLHEEGLLRKTRIYATDIDEQALATAKSGISSIDLMKEYSKNYMSSGGKRAFSEYYTANYDHAVIRSFLKDHIFFSNHNLVCDRKFNEFNVVLCRNVMIYFDDDLQNKVHGLFHESLCRFGVLILGKKESIDLTDFQHKYSAIDEGNKIYRRIES